VYLLASIKTHICARLRALCSSQNPISTDETTATEICIIYYDSNMPRELTAACSATTGDTIGLFIQGHMDFSSEFCNVHKHI